MLALAMGLTALPASAGDGCHAPMDRWQSREAVRLMAAQRGWQIQRLKTCATAPQKSVCRCLPATLRNAVDPMAAVLQRHGVRRALVALGGELRAVGSLAVATSGDYRRCLRGPVLAKVWRWGILGWVRKKAMVDAHARLLQAANAGRVAFRDIL